MGKLSLKIENLKVDSFNTGAEGRNGTVRAHDTVETEWCTGYPDCGVSKKCQTPHDTCYGTCGCTQNCDTYAPNC
jgi:hypothetical protein